MYPFDEKFLAKAEELRAAGVDLYPNGLVVTHTSTQLHAKYRDADEPEPEPVAIGGRVMFRNRFGKAMFLRVQDRGEPTVEGTDEEGNPVRRGGVIQVWVRRDEVGEEAFDLVKKIDIGDFVWVRGTMMRTRTGELTVKASEARLASKIMTPFPDRWHGVEDIETRSRQRYVDLFMHGETREAFRRRSRILRYMREFFWDREFLEVETPMLQTLPGGAAARPFATHHNALDLTLYLRIAPELFLKRLVVGGLERVFEINRNFRNEGISPRHNPEFTMLEFYMAWATYDDLMELTETLLSGLVQEVCGTTEVAWGERTIDWSAPFKRADMDALIAEYTGLTREQLRDPAAMERYWREQHPDEDGDVPSTVGKWWEWMFDAFVEHHLTNPTFVTGFPTEISPLARRNDADPTRVDRFELIVAGWEMANAFSELNDPVDQAGRFEAQVKARDEGDDEAMYFDHDYVRALTYAMPPAAGLGLGVDRLVMMLTDRQHIKEVLLFPTLRPERWETAE